MQPLYLKIRGFGPFLDAEIPRDAFEVISKERLFLVSGEIGAGKTTLFDAIVYAIFGETSFPDRSPADLISQLLPKNSPYPPEVTFEFLLQNRVYRIIRRPKFGAYSSHISLWIDGRLSSNNDREVKSKIRDLFGLDGAQFKKVFIIPQGEYRRILLAKPEEKRALFEHIFDTKILTDLQEYFTKTLKEKEAELRGLLEREQELLKLAEVGHLGELKEKLSRAEELRGDVKKEILRVSETIRKLDIELKEFETFTKILDEIKRLKGELETLEKEKGEVENLKARIHLLRRLKERALHYERARKLWQEMKRKKEEERSLRARLSSLEKTFAELEEKFKYLQIREPEIEKKREEIRSLEGTLEKLRKRETLLAEIERLWRQIHSYEHQLEDLNRVEEEIQRELDSLTDEAKRFRNFRELELELKKVIEELSLHEEFLRDRETLSELLRRLDLISEERDRLKKEHERLKDESLAVVLAQKLKKGEPCPVCGSTDHPKKAQPGLWQKLSLEECEKKLAEKEEIFKKTQEEIHKIRGKLEHLETKLRGSIEDLIKRRESLEEALSLLQIESFRFKKLDLYDEKEKELKTHLEEIRRHREEVRNSVEKLKRNVASIEGELRGISLGYIETELNVEILQRRILDLRGEVESFQREKEEVERRLMEIEKERVRIKAQLESHGRYLLEIVADYKESFREILRLVKEGVFPSLKELKNAWEDLKNLSRYEDEVSSFEEKYRMLTQRLDLLSEELERFGEKWKERVLEDPHPHLQKLKNERDILEKKKEELNRELGRVENILSQLGYIEKTLFEIINQKRILDEEYSLLRYISEIISGKPKGVSFHSFVLSRFLSLILKRANFYFREFTSGRFAFVEGEIFTRGFVLEVFDSYTGQKRELKTLSGGESFLASLAFALGTSDILLRLSKRPPLETILIDEGFGSLDEASLEKVTDTLISVSQRSGKIIGLISHLREMKERIPLVIEIVKTENRGSIIQRIKRNY